MSRGRKEFLENFQTVIPYPANQDNAEFEIAEVRENVDVVHSHLDSKGMLGELKEKRNVMDSPKMDTFIGKESEFSGKLIFEGTLRIDGKLKGEIYSEGLLIVGPGAEIEAEIKIGTAVIAGNVKGNITAKKEVELKAPGRLNGNIYAPSLVIQRGVIFKGTSNMEASDAPISDEIPAIKSDEIPSFQSNTIMPDPDADV